MDRKVNILLATYNGSLYIENQLLSLISQSHTNWLAFIHDDGSSDDTVEILKRYQSLDKRINIIEDNIVCGGAGKNFLHLLQYVNAEYVMFCDQDDIWLERKVEVMLSSFNNESPGAIYCNSHLFNGTVILDGKATVYQRDTLKNALFLNSGVQGCSLMFNIKLLDIIKDVPSYVYMHDHFITLAAIAFGKLKYIDYSLMLYRQHDKNVTGNISIGFKARFKSFINRNNTIIERRHYEANVSFFKKYRQLFSRQQIEVFEAYVRFPKSNLFEKLLIIYKYKFSIGNSTTALILKTLLKKAI